MIYRRTGQVEERGFISSYRGICASGDVCRWGVSAYWGISAYWGMCAAGGYVPTGGAVPLRDVCCWGTRIYAYRGISASEECVPLGDSDMCLRGDQCLWGMCAAGGYVPTGGSVPLGDLYR
jgi:hypothetical protein